MVKPDAGVDRSRAIVQHVVHARAGLLDRQDERHKRHLVGVAPVHLERVIRPVLARLEKLLDRDREHALVAAASDPFVRRLLKASANKRRALASGAGELMSQQKDGAILVLLGGGTLSLAGRLAHEAAAAAAAVVAVVFCTGQHRSRQSHAEQGRRPQRTCSRVVHKAPAGNLPSKRVGAHLGHRTSSREEREPRGNRWNCCSPSSFDPREKVKLFPRAFWGPNFEWEAGP